MKPSNTSVVALNIDMVRQLYYVNVLITSCGTALAPTFLVLAGFPIPDDLDGQSLKSVLYYPLTGNLTVSS